VAEREFYLLLLVLLLFMPPEGEAAVIKRERRRDLAGLPMLETGQRKLQMQLQPKQIQGLEAEAVPMKALLELLVVAAAPAL
jgi:hypothetical protein